MPSPLKFQRPRLLFMMVGMFLNRNIPKIPTSWMPLKFNPPAIAIFVVNQGFQALKPSCAI